MEFIWSRKHRKKVISVKLKYKKLVLAISVGTICIGGIALSLVNNHSNQQKKHTTKNISVTDDKFTAGTYKSQSGDLVLEKNAHPEINELVKQYFAARVAGDMDKLGTLVSDIKYVNGEELQTLGTYVEEYQNIDTYTVAAKEKDSYIVLAYTDIKLKDIKTTAPGLSGLYVNKDGNGNYVIYNGMMTDEQNMLKDEVYACDGVKELIHSVQDKYQKALASDKELNAFYTDAKKEKQEQAEEGIPKESTSETSAATKEAE